MTTPSLEAIQEINVITSNYTAEWARNGGGVVNVVTKSGTSRFSGSAYDFLRNDALNANSFFRNMEPETGNQQHTTAAPVQQLRVHARRTGAAKPQQALLLRFPGVAAEHARQGDSVARRSRSVVADRTPPVQTMSRPKRATRMRSNCSLSGRHRTFPGPNRYRTTITNALDTRQEFVRADYNASANWSLIGSLPARAGRLARRVLHRAGPRARPSLSGRAPRGRGSAAVGGRLLHESSYQLSKHDAVAE